MGHDITATGTRTGKEISLRMSVNDCTLISHFYHALGAEDLNGGLSGVMAKRLFSKEDLDIISKKYFYFKEEDLKPDTRGLEAGQAVLSRMFGDEVRLQEEGTVDFNRLDKFFREVQGEDFIIDFY